VTHNKDELNYQWSRQTNRIPYFTIPYLQSKKWKPQVGCMIGISPRFNRKHAKQNQERQHTYTAVLLAIFQPYWVSWMASFWADFADQMQLLTLNGNSWIPQPFYGSFSGTTRVSRCQKRTSGFMVQGKINRGRHWLSGWTPLHPDQPVPTSTIPQFFYRPDALPAAQLTVSKHWRTSAFGLRRRR